MSWMPFSMSIAPAFSGVTCPMIILGGMWCTRISACAVKRRGSSAGVTPARQLKSLQPVAIGAAVEATKPPKPSMQRVASGDSASRQAVTRVNAEQAPKGLTWEPTRRGNGEGRRHWGTGGHTPRSDANQWSHRGIGDGMPAHGDPTQHGKPRAVAGVTANWRPARAGPGRSGWRTGPYDRGRRVTPAEGRGLSSRLTSEGA